MFVYRAEVGKRPALSEGVGVPTVPVGRVSDLQLLYVRASHVHSLSLHSCPMGPIKDEVCSRAMYCEPHGQVKLNMNALQLISERLAKTTNGRTVKWRDVTISLTACHYITPIAQYCHLL